MDDASFAIDDDDFYGTDTFFLILFLPDFQPLLSYTMRACNFIYGFPGVESIVQV